MRAVILVAGESKRLKPITDNIPKCLLDISGQPILGRQLHWLESCGVKDVTMVVGYLSDQIRNYVSDYVSRNRSSIKIKFVDNKVYASTNNAYSLLLALNEDDSPFILFNGDVVFHQNILKQVIESKYRNCFSIQRKRTWIDEDMKADFDASGKITRVSKELTPDKTVMKDSYEFTGIAKISENIQEFKDELTKYPKGWFECALDDMISKGTISFYAEDIENKPYVEVDFVADLELAREIFPWGMHDSEIGMRHGANVDADNAFNLLKDMVDTLKKHDIKYWVNWGLLLGLYRDRNFIPWDTDLDVTVHVEDREKVWNLVTKDMKKKSCFVPDREVCHHGDCWFIRDKERVELNFVERVGDTYEYESDGSSLACPVEYIDKLDKVIYRGYEFNIPSNTAEYLRKLTGRIGRRQFEARSPQVWRQGGSYDYVLVIICSFPG